MEKPIVDKINSSRYKLFFSLAGGGVKFLSDYLAFGGASKVLIGANVPYNQKTFDKFIRGQKVDSYASEQGARKLAVSSYLECLDIGIPKENIWGIGASCSIASVSKEAERVDRKHKIHVAFHGYNSTHALNLILAQGRRRVEEENILENLIYNELAWLSAGCVIPPKPLGLRSEAGESFSSRVCEPHKELLPLCTGDPKLDYFIRYRRPFLEEHDTIGVYCGSWNPLHDAHKIIHGMSQALLRCPVFLELTVNNAEKGLVDYVELEDRQARIDDFNHILTRAPLLRQKVPVLKSAFPNKKIVFVMGYDTWIRVWDQRYCMNGSLLQEYDFFKSQGVSFLVFGRGGAFKPLDGGWGEDLRIKKEDAENFRMDISSSSLRKSL